MRRLNFQRRLGDGKDYELPAATEDEKEVDGKVSELSPSINHSKHSRNDMSRSMNLSQYQKLQSSS
jgi:hypothetical protein